MIFCFSHKWFYMHSPPLWVRARVCLKCGKLQYYQRLPSDCPVPEIGWINQRRMPLPEVMELVLTQ